MKEFIDKLISRLEEREVRAYANMDGGVTYQAYRNAIEIVIELAEEYKGGWIPYSKKMPKEGTHRDVWISLENKVVSYRAKWYLDHFEWENGFAIKERIVAWMPNDVPEPYMEGETELYRAKSVDGDYQEYKGDWK